MRKHEGEAARPAAEGGHLSETRRTRGIGRIAAPRAGWIALLLVALVAGFAALGLRPEQARVGPDREAAAGRAAQPRGPAEDRGAFVSPQRRRHILDGDATGGGHRPGTGFPGKSEFPRGWSDDRIIAAILDVANDPASRRRVEADGRTVVTGTRDGVEMRVVVDRDGRSVVTGYPVNLPRNPRS